MGCELFHSKLKTQNLELNFVLFFFEDIDFTNQVLQSRVLFAAFLLLVHNLQRKSYRNIFSAWLFNFIGTFFHEMAHLIVGILFNAKPTNFSLIPRKSEHGGYVMGHVRFANISWYNAFPIAMAPLLLLLLAVFIDIYFFQFFEVTLLNYFFYLLVLIVTISSSIPSSQDFKVAGIYFWGLVFYGIFFIVLSALVGELVKIV